MTDRHTPIRPAFTLVEVLVVVAIIGIAGAVVVPQLLQTGSLTIQGASRMVIADLLAAQNEAVAQQRPRRVVFEPALNRYRLTDQAGQTIQMNWRSSTASSGDYIIDFDRDTRFRGVRLDQASFGGQSSIEFDDMGAPSSGGTIDLVADKFRYRISVAPFTGRVTIQPVAGG